ncbi:hypothetical protein BH09SUM1_BH09SUM1_09030 [soil metagenome]
MTKLTRSISIAIVLGSIAAPILGAGEEKIDKSAAVPAATPAAPALSWRVVVEKAKTPPVDDPATPVHEDMYESTLTIFKVEGAKETAVGTFAGSYRPDDSEKSCTIKAGTYPISIGFHKRSDKEGKTLTPKPEDLKAKGGNEKLRPCLILNADGPVPAASGPRPTGSTIHVHNGFKTERGSTGCVTLNPDNWIPFIQTFVTAYPDFKSWTSDGGYRGAVVGKLELKGNFN